MRTRAWVWSLIAGGLLIAVYLWLPMSHRASLAVYSGIGALCVAVMVVAISRHRSLPRVWVLLTIGIAWFVLGDLVWNLYEWTGHAAPFPSWADVAYLLGYPFLAAGLWRISRGRQPLAVHVDTAIVVIGAATVIWAILGEPNEGSFSLATSVALAYPVMDVLLLALVVRMVFVRGAGTVALRLVLSAVALQLVGDLVFGVLVLGGIYQDRNPVDGLFLATYVLLAVAAWHSSADREAIGSGRPASQQQRMSVISIVSVVPVTVLAAGHWIFGSDTEAPIKFGVISFLVAGLIAVRMSGMVRRLERAAEEQTRLGRAKDLFLNAVSHELRTPLTAIRGFAATLKNLGPDLDPVDRDDMVRRLDANARKLERLTLDLLDMDRLGRGVVEARTEDRDLSTLVEECVRSFEAPPGRDLRLHVEPVTVPMDGAKVERILENLLSNALRHTPEGSPVEVSAGPCPGGAMISVDDRGGGVPDELKGTIFEPFKQAVISAHSPGIGVGLSLVEGFASLHGGRAWVEDRSATSLPP